MKTPIRLSHALVFTSLFTRYASFPTDRARDTVPQLYSARSWSWSRTEEAGGLALQGMLKLSFYPVLVPIYLKLLDSPGTSGLSVVVGSWILFVCLWLIFAGRTDLVRALALFLGIRITQNFDAPLTCPNIAEFWRRFNTSVFAFLSEDVFAKINFALRRWGDLGLAVACIATFVGSGLAHALIPSNVSWGLFMGVAMFVYLLSRKRIRKWSKSFGHPTLVAVASWFLTYNFISLCSLFEVHTSIHWVLGILLSAFSGPIWPALFHEIDWLPTLATIVAAVALQTIPHYFGGDSWMCSLRPRSRMAWAFGMLGLLLLWNWK